VPTDGIDGFLATIDVLAVPAYDDAIAAPLIAALRGGKSVIVPDPSGAAELVEYGRHGLMFCAGSAYHFANAIDIVSQSWSQKPVLLADGGPAIARTHPAAVAHTFATVYRRLAPAADQTRANAPKPSHG
jgi:glycosyltransferase involved in cell wall biosynthesis